MRSIVVAALAAAFSCSAAPRIERAPSPDHPLIGCILPTTRQSGSREGKILPETVRVIGRTPIDDGERWIVLRGPNFDPRKWEPHAASEIHFGAVCGAETRALNDLFRASRGDLDASTKTRPQ